MGRILRIHQAAKRFAPASEELSNKAKATFKEGKSNFQRRPKQLSKKAKATFKEGKRSFRKRQKELSEKAERAFKKASEPIPTDHKTSPSYT